MTSWRNLADDAPDLAARVRSRLEAHQHHVLATVTLIGSPRVSGTEVGWWDEHLWMGSMWRSRKALDLRSDPRFALHSNPGDGSMAGGDAKINGTAREVAKDDPQRIALIEKVSPPEPFHLFWLDLSQVVLTSLDGDRLRIETWRPGQGVSVQERS